MIQESVLVLRTQPLQSLFSGLPFSFTVKSKVCSVSYDYRLRSLLLPHEPAVALSVLLNVQSIFSERELGRLVGFRLRERHRKTNP